MTSWNVDFLKPITQSSRSKNHTADNKLHGLNEKKRFEDEENVTRIGAEFALIILNQPFSFALLRRVWSSSGWRCCADGGANRLYDLLKSLHIDPRKCVVEEKSECEEALNPLLDIFRI
jgi:thiamine pyrophosphokinase